MYRRRLRQRAEIAFSFDSFLDVVANVCGIVVRLILVAWVGGRSYSAMMQWNGAAPSSTATVKTKPRPEDDPLSGRISEAQRELEAARARLLAQLKNLELAVQTRQNLTARFMSLNKDRDALAQERIDLDRADSIKEQSARFATLSMDELRRRQQALLDELKKVEALPPPTKELRYRTPVSRAVQADEVFFELQGDRVAYIDVPAFLQEVHGGLEGRAETLRTRFKIEDVTRQIGAFRLRYFIEREPDAVDAFGQTAKPSTETNFRYGVTGWAVEPLLPTRGEPLAVALTPTSEFRRIVDGLDATTVVTFWVYPDSFEAFRRLRDDLYARGLEVAGRPLPAGSPIAASRHGSVSRGQ